MMMFEAVEAQLPLVQAFCLIRTPRPSLGRATLFAVAVPQFAVAGMLLVASMVVTVAGRRSPPLRPVWTQSWSMQGTPAAVVQVPPEYGLKYGSEVQLSPMPGTVGDGWNWIGLLSLNP